MNTEEQNKANVLALKQFEETFAKIQREVVLPDPWVSTGGAVDICSRGLSSGDVVKTTARGWVSDDSTETKVIIIMTPAGPLGLFPITQKSSSGKPTIEERTFIQPRIPEALYGLINKRVDSPIGPEDLAWLIDKEHPEVVNIGKHLVYFLEHLVPKKPFKQTEF